MKKLRMTPDMAAKRYKNMRRYVYSIFVCLLVLAACSPRWCREQTTRTHQQEQSSDSLAVTKHAESTLNEQSQSKLEKHESFNQVTTWEQLSKPDSTGAQWVTARGTTTTSGSSDVQRESSANRHEKQLEQEDSTNVSSSSSELEKEEEKSVEPADNKKSTWPWYVYVASIVGAFIIGLVLGLRKRRNDD